MNFSKPMISHKMMTKKFSQIGNKALRKNNLLVIPSSCNFSFLKNSLMQINSKLNLKTPMITYTNAFSISAFGLHRHKMSILPQQKGLEFLRGGVSARPKQLKK